MWDLVDDSRWSLPDDVRHLLLLADGVLAELHGQTVHRYRAPEQIDDPAWPLADAAWIDTVVLDEPPATDEQGWDVLAARAGAPT